MIDERALSPVSPVVTAFVSRYLILAAFLCVPFTAAAAPPAENKPVRILGLTGQVDKVETAVPAAEQISLVGSAASTADIDLKRMAEWALNYLAETPRKSLGYEPVFQCHPLLCPPVPAGQDPVVACDTDARM